MYLKYDDFKEMGGVLDETAFKTHARKAEYMLNSQSAGRTGKRINTLINAGEGVPQAVKDCIYELICYLSVNAVGSKKITSESQSLGGQSESVSYAMVTEEQVNAECENIIYGTMFGGGCGNLLYLGACDLDVEQFI